MLGITIYKNSLPTFYVFALLLLFPIVAIGQSNSELNKQGTKEIILDDKYVPNGITPFTSTKDKTKDIELQNPNYAYRFEPGILLRGGVALHYERKVSKRTSIKPLLGFVFAYDFMVSQSINSTLNATQFRYSADIASTRNNKTGLIAGLAVDFSLGDHIPLSGTYWGLGLRHLNYNKTINAFFVNEKYPNHVYIPYNAREFDTYVEFGWNSKNISRFSFQANVMFGLKSVFLTTYKPINDENLYNAKTYIKNNLEGLHGIYFGLGLNFGFKG